MRPTNLWKPIGKSIGRFHLIVILSNSSSLFFFVLFFKSQKFFVVSLVALVPRWRPSRDLTPIPSLFSPCVFCDCQCVFSNFFPISPLKPLSSLVKCIQGLYVLKRPSVSFCNNKWRASYFYALSLSKSKKEWFSCDIRLKGYIQGMWVIQIRQLTLKYKRKKPSRMRIFYFPFTAMDLLAGILTFFL
jgi:hypothetical protein